DDEDGAERVADGAARAGLDEGGEALEEAEPAGGGGHRHLGADGEERPPEHAAGRLELGGADLAADERDEHAGDAADGRRGSMRPAERDADRGRERQYRDERVHPAPILWHVRRCGGDQNGNSPSALRFWRSWAFFFSA